ncbi:NTF2-domain-containing protein [Neocallimastix lanati (nom. inval.)]|uniref:NTF2-domain-containing protein n=1 Tax=Neocallimastix californiae TaxID=1754190 RepID=A0A1Y2AW76_9FUNG|nr:NTF2-domain-containing protein [Neocallimastix sp. JGI-2020a]ORY26818.1 NTF2-domain-containing protein [Neocallimastix californiae]|eukprot:ORY26818.1 NTF2-domain-containing protein [Neocallimastix californiae]
MSDKQFSPFEVSWLFVQEYYTIMNNSPEKLHQFYNKDSYYCNGSEGESSKIYHGQSEINKRIKELEYEDCKVLVSNVDSQISSGDGIIIQVLGEMSNKGGASHKFAQTFFLAKQPNGYFVLNDIIRFLKEDIENEYEDFDTPNENYVSQDQYMDNQNSNIISEEIIEQMNESLVIDNDATLEEKENLETIETNPIVEEKKVENETFEKVEGPTSATAKLNDTQETNEVPKVENKSLPNSNIQKTSQGRRQEQKINFEREIFIKDVNENISKDKLKEAFSKFGEVKNIDVFYNRHNGFVEFATVESVKKAIAAKSVIIDGHKVIAEEKHKRKGFNSSYGNRNRNEYRDSRYQSGKSGNYINRGKSIRSK